MWNDPKHFDRSGRLDRGGRSRRHLGRTIYQCGETMSDKEPREVGMMWIHNPPHLESKLVKAIQLRPDDPADLDELIAAAKELLVCHDTFCVGSKEWERLRKALEPKQ